LDVVGNASVHAEKLLIDEGCDGKLVEEVHDSVVDFLVVLGEA
jgi:hypothetical protein